jgi:hypothetical protein
VYSQHGVEDAGREYALRSDLAMADLQGVRETADVDIVRAVDEDDMDTAHSRGKWDDAPGHDFVLAEEALIADVPTGDSDAYDDDGEDGAPPTVEQGWVVGDTGATLWRRCIVEAAR